ncbi:MAG: SpoIIE family protein phosphatase [Leptospiraceae bacterium]|nr:SpoIIE family protein phosphatase [Leptospiraceae bacterium]
MKYILLLLLSILSHQLQANENISVDLTKDCSKQKECEPNFWYVIDSFEPSYFEIREPDQSWKKIDHFPIWMNKIFSKEGDLATYTLITYFDIPNEILNHNEQTGIRFGEIGEVFEIYINGNLIAKEGEITDNKVTFHRTVRGKVWQVPKNFIQANNNHLLVKISGHPKFDHTGFYLTKYYDFGLYDTLKYDEQDRVSLALIVVYLVVGLYHLFLFYRRRIELYNFYYGAFAFIIGVYVYTRSSAIFEHNWDTAIIQRVELTILYPGALFLIESLDILFFHTARKWTKFFSYFSYTLCFITVFCPEMFHAEYILRLWQVTMLFYGLPLMIKIFYDAIKKEIPNAKRLLVGFIFFIFAGIYDILDSALLNSGLSFVKYAFFMYIVGFAGVLANRFISVHNEIEELNLNLEHKVEDRTKELSKSLDEIRFLKDQQDGDYFLTSLLLQPLGANQANSQNVKVDFLVKQKKQFKFKQWESEIGGDLCRSKTIYFRQKPMTVFLNADAMGKSMQGAGGALVTGAVFNSIIERTILSPEVQDQFPERWLKNAFIEMHKVFESFEGSTLISVVMGVLDNTSGLLYLINAEHPCTVLIRDGEPSFIGNEKMYRKLGSSIVDDFIFIQTFQMRDGDIIINGSDGRDDIMIPDTETGEKFLNYDENAFLKVTKKAEGDLNKIYEELTHIGEFTDDLSLVRIEYTNPNLAIQTMDNQESPEIEIGFDKITEETLEKLNLKLEEYYNESTQNLHALKYICIAYIRLKQYTTSIRLIQEYLEKIPSDTIMFYYLSYAYKKNRNFEESIDYGERVRIRNPYHLKNLINLVQSYASSGKLFRAQEILESASRLQPENEKIQRLKTQIDKALTRN